MDQLYWLGRYSERVYTTLRMFAVNFDAMIDLDTNEYAEYCAKMEIPAIYTSREDFTKRYCFDEEDPNSIYSNLMRAYDNAIVLREEIGSETLSYIQLAVYEMNKAKLSDAPLIQLQKVIDNIVAFWGLADDFIDGEYVRNIIKVGKRIERIDLYGRLHVEKKEMIREVHRLTGRIARSGLQYYEEKLAHLNWLVQEETLDYAEIVKEVESLIR